MSFGSRIRAVLSDARARAGGEAAVGTAGRGAATDRPDTSLFECPDCHTVYVAVEKSTCSSCDAAVEEVAATLSTE
ncbi:MAG: hypothetical protein ABEI39_01135 [Halobacteriales archaeon]